MKLKDLAIACCAVVLLGACVPSVDLPPEPAVDTLSLPVYGTEEVWQASDYQGKPVLVAVMATWCPWCKRSLSALDKTSAAYAGQVEVVGLFIDEDPTLVEKVQKEYNIQSKVLYDGDEAAQELGAQGFPHIVLFDKKHRVAKVWSGYSDTLADQYAAEINKLLK